MNDDMSLCSLYVRYGEGRVIHMYLEPFRCLDDMWEIVKHMRDVRFIDLAILKPSGSVRDFFCLDTRPSS